jgi:hypothetical protein
MFTLADSLHTVALDGSIDLRPLRPDARARLEVMLFVLILNLEDIRRSMRYGQRKSWWR